MGKRSKHAIFKGVKMTAIFRSNGQHIFVEPTVDINAGDVLSIGGLVCVAVSPLFANKQGTVQTVGEYDLSIEPGTAYEVGDYITCEAKELDGTPTTVTFGPVVRKVETTDSVARAKLVCMRGNVEDATGGTAGASIVAPAGASYTTEELKANFATIAAALNS